MARDRQEHERQLKLEELEEQRQTRLWHERRQVYSEYTLRWTLYEEVKRAFEQLAPDSPQKLDKAYRQLLRTFNALSLIAPEEVRAAALDLRDWSDLNEEERDLAVPGRYWKAARKDLGIPL